MKTLSYGRVSTADQANGYSLDSQRVRAAEYASFKGWPTPIHFSDDGVSGTRRARPGLDALLGAVRQGDVLLTKDVYRLGRGGAAQTLGIISEIEERGASIVFLDQNIDTSTALGRMLLTIIAGFGELELEQTRERSHYGKLQAARRGHWPMGNVPYGYAREGRQLVPHPENAAHVREAFRALAGKSLNAAMRDLNERGIPNNRERGGRGLWNVPRLHDLLNNPAYVGRGRVSIGGQTVEIPTPPLISEELWETVRDRASSQGGLSRPDLYPLTGHLRCPHGAPYSGETVRGRGAGGGDWRVYEVSSGARRRYGCRCGQAGAEALEREARERLAAVFEDPADPAHARLLLRPAAYDPDPHEQERQEVQAQLGNLATLQVRGLIDLEDYMRLRSDLKAREAALVRPEQPAPAHDLQAMADAAERVRDSDALQLSRLLDVLRAHFVLTDRTALAVASVTMF